MAVAMQCDAMLWCMCVRRNDGIMCVMHCLVVLCCAVCCESSQAAVSYEHSTLVEMLLHMGADPNLADADGDTPLHLCESAEIAQTLIAAGANPHARNAEGKTVSALSRTGVNAVCCLLALLHCACAIGIGIGVRTATGHSQRG